jgi:hypothetical protein
MIEDELGRDVAWASEGDAYLEHFEFARVQRLCSEGAG